MGDMTNNFSRHEFACGCGCGLDNISIEFVEDLQDVRDAYGMAIKISSGCRCRKHNADVEGIPNSSHLFRVGADLVMPNNGKNKHALMRACFIKFKRVFLYRDHIHVDEDITKPCPSAGVHIY